MQKWLAIAAQPQRPSHQRAPCGSHVSWRSVRDAYDNALAESHFARPEIEQVHHRVWKNVAPARLARRLVLAGQPRLRRSGVRPIQPVNFEKSLQAGQGQAFAFGVDGRGVRSHQGGCRRLTAKSAHGAVCTAQAI